MWPSIILVLLMTFVFLMLFFTFIQDAVIAAVNLLIIYLAGLRSSVEIRKGYDVNYIIGAILSAFIIFFWQNVFPLWTITAFVLQTFVIAQIVSLIRKIFARQTTQRKKKIIRLFFL